ncbi:MAG TPA: TonB-dependent receptor [Candidatus Eisenbacteria bacterium]|nr:TonB-dependent receptor [Candidatus Eisenbacteria bacterium]
MFRKTTWATVAAVAAVLAVTLIHPAWSGTTGKLTGVVKNEKGQPLTGVNVRLEGLRIGALSDEQGHFLLIGIPAGEYPLRANLMGHAPYLANKVQIAPDFTTEYNIELKTEAVQMAEVRVDAERPLLQKDATNTVRFLTSDEIERMPTRGYQEAAAQQAGIVNFQRQLEQSQNNTTLIVRGGRPNETVYYLDGFTQNDVFTGHTATSINNNAIQELVVQNGGFSAEYGNVMSGVINVITKEGSDKYTGNFEAVTDNFSGSGKKFLGSRVYDFNLYDANFGGPILPGKDWGNFYVSAQRRWQGDRSPNSGFSSLQPFNGLSGWTGQGKLTLPLGNQAGLKLGGLFSKDDWLQYINAYRFNLKHLPRTVDYSRAFNGQFTHTLNSRTFYSLSGNQSFIERRRGDRSFFNDANGWFDYSQYAGRVQPGNVSGIPWFRPGISDMSSPLGQIIGQQALAAGNDGFFFPSVLRRQSQYWAARGEFTSQINPNHQVKTGGQFNRHTLRYYLDLDPDQFPNVGRSVDRYGFSNDGSTEEDDPLDGPRHPVTAWYFVQDKYEKAGLVVNAGLRWDYLNTDTPALRNELQPLGPDVIFNAADDLVANKKYNEISPRIGIGFPVTDRTVMHANWGKFTQHPNLQDLLVSYRFLEKEVRTGGGFVFFGNPNLRPEKTTAYEVGVAHRLGTYAKLDLTAYYKDVKDLVQVQTVRADPYSFSTYQNVDFATIKGFDLGVTLRRVNRIQAAVAYSLSYASGTGSISLTQRNIAWGETESPKQSSLLDYDQRHKLSINLDYLLARGEGPVLGGMRPLSDFNINVLFNVSSGTPFTPTTIWDEVSLQNLAAEPAGPINSRFGPWSQTLDFKATKGFTFGSANAKAFVWVLNALDAKNANTVFTGTGSALTTGYFDTNEGQAVAQGLRDRGLDPNAVYGLALQDESLFSNPRMVRFGLGVGF